MSPPRLSWFLLDFGLSRMETLDPPSISHKKKDGGLAKILGKIFFPQPDFRKRSRVYGTFLKFVC